MRRNIFTLGFISILIMALLPALTSCFSGSPNASKETTSPAAVTPNPEVISVVATTSGTQTAYFATLAIKVKNAGAEGAILVKASVTQNGKSNSNEMPVFLKQNETHELKLTFPLVWQGGDFTSKVEAVMP